VVFYQALYGDYGFWVRPLSMFLESVEVDGEQVPRFALVQAEPSLFRVAAVAQNLRLTSPCCHYI
jgi:hypothetical protein